MKPSRRAAGTRVGGARSATRALPVALPALLAATSAAATEYQVNPRVELGGGYNDNVTLVTGAGVVAAPEALADARVDFVAAESNWQMRAMPEVRGTWYSGHSELNSNGEFLNLEAQRTGPRYSLDVFGYGASELLLSSYLPTANIGSGLGVAEPGTTLATSASVRQNLGYVRPVYEFQMTPRRSLELNVEYTYATYDQVKGGYTNYRNLAGAAGLALKATPTGSVTLRAVARDFHPDVGPTADTYGAEVQWDGKFTATKLYYLRVGGQRTDLSGTLPGESVPVTASATTTVTGGAGTHWTYTLTEVFADLTRDVQPTGQGYAVTRNQLRLRVARRFTPRFAGFVGARGIYDDPLPGSVAPGIQAQRYYYGTVGFEWRFVRQFTVIGAYDYTNYHYGGAAAARANAAYLSLVYEPHRPENGPAITVGY